MNRIKELRLSREWQQEDVATKLNVTKATISRYEQEKRQLDPVTIGKLCDLFGCTSDYLLCRSDSPYAAILDEDARILRMYHALPLEIRRAVDGLMAPYEQISEEKNVG